MGIHPASVSCVGLRRRTSDEMTDEGEISIWGVNVPSVSGVECKHAHCRPINTIRL